MKARPKLASWTRWRKDKGTEEKDVERHALLKEQVVSEKLRTGSQD